LTRTNQIRRLSAGETLPASGAGDAEDRQGVDPKAAHLYKIAEAAQAAVDLLRLKLASAEAEIDRLRRELTAVAAELYSESTARKAVEARLACEHERLLTERAAGLTALTSSTFDPLFWQPARVGACSEWWTYVPFAHWIVRAAAPRVLVELGTFTGVSYSAFCNAVVEAGLPTRCHAIDTWEGYSEVYEDFCQFHEQYYNKFSTLLRCTFDEALSQFSDNSIDLLHIDGLHSYEAVRHDFESWLPKLSRQGVILFHETNVREQDFGVWRLWEELSRQYPSFEFLHNCGLGVLAIGEAVPEAVLALCRLTDPTAVGKFRSRFASIGERWSQSALLRDTIAAFTGVKAEAEQLRLQKAAQDSVIQELRTDLLRFEALAKDRAIAAEMAENAAALKAGELNQARAEIARRSTWRAMRLPGWAWRRRQRLPIAVPRGGSRSTD
jgi:Methyltransferase domain